MLSTFYYTHKVEIYVSQHYIFEVQLTQEMCYDINAKHKDTHPNDRKEIIVSIRHTTDIVSKI